MLRECDTRQMTDGEIREAFVKCFAGREGMIVLSHLKRLTLRRWLGPDASVDELRHLEGQRHLVRDRKSTRLNSSHKTESRMPSSA